MTLWRGRFKEDPSSDLLDFSSSLSFDVALAPYDIRGTRAHLASLAGAGLLSEEERSVLEAALSRVEEELASGAFSFKETDEDIHTAIERRVTEIAGEPGRKIHTGRSRNDQVVCALRLYLKDHLVRVGQMVVELAQAFLRKAELYPDVYMPAYTHLQRAQPVLLAHYLLAHAWPLVRDAERVIECISRVDVCPLGAGAVGGSSLPLASDAARSQLGFAKIFDNSIDAVSSRDFVIESAYVIAQVGLDVSRFAEDVVIFASSEFSFFSIPDSLATGSSALPQKKNPDVAELLRAKAARLEANLVWLMTLVKGLPLAYNRDLQEDKPPIFDSVAEVERMLPIAVALVEGIQVNEAQMASAADNVATVALDLAEWLVSQGVPFREAHAMVASLVRESQERRVPLEELVVANPRMGERALEVLSVRDSVKRRRSWGSTHPDQVRAQKERLRQRLGNLSERLASLAS